MFLNAWLVLTIAMLNLTSVVFSLVPMSAGVGFLLWVGILITAQAFEQVRHTSNRLTCVRCPGMNVMDISTKEARATD